MFAGSSTRERKQKGGKSLWVSFFPAHKNCIQFTFECCSNFTVNLTTDGSTMCHRAKEYVFVTHLIHRIVKRVFCAIPARQRDLARRLDVEAFSKYFSIITVDARQQWCCRFDGYLSKKKKLTSQWLQEWRWILMGIFTFMSEHV